MTLQNLQCWGKGHSPTVKRGNVCQNKTNRSLIAQQALTLLFLTLTPDATESWPGLLWPHSKGKVRVSLVYHVLAHMQLCLMGDQPCYIWVVEPSSANWGINWDQGITTGETNKAVTTDLLFLTRCSCASLFHALSNLLTVQVPTKTLSQEQIIIHRE